MTIDQPLYLWIPSQVLAAISLVFIVWALLVKDKGKTLVLMSVHMIVMIVALCLLQDWILVGILSIAVMRNGVFYFFERRPGKVWKYSPFFAMVFFSLATVAVVIAIALIEGHWWVDWVLLGLSVIFIVAIWLRGIHFFRIVGLFYAAFIIYNYVVIQNYIGVFIEAVIIISIFMFYVKLFAEAKARKNLVDDGFAGLGATDLPDVVEGGDNVDGGQIKGDGVQI